MKNPEYTKLQERRDELKKQLDATTQRIGELKKQQEASAALAHERDQAALRLEFLMRRAAVREKYLAKDISNTQRQKEMSFNGIRPQRMDVVHFHIPKVGDKEEMDGVALVRDENHYYIAVDMYEQPDQPDNITTIMDENPDGTFDGIWPKCIVLKPASKFEERYMRGLTDQYADELDKAEAFVVEKAKKEREEMEALTAKTGELNKQLADYDAAERQLNEARRVQLSLNFECHKTEEALAKIPEEVADAEEKPGPEEQGKQEEQEGLEFNLQESDYEPMEGIESDTDIEQRLPHLPYLRGKRQMTTMSYPAIELTMSPWLRYRLMGNVARLMGVLQRQHALTYVMSEEYFEELKHRGSTHYKGMLPQDVVHNGEKTAGVIVYPNQGHEDTILYSINNRDQMSIIVVYIRDGVLMFYESFTEQSIIGEPRTDVFVCQTLREAGTDQKRLFSWIRNLIISFMAMERDMGRTVSHLVEDGIGSAQETDIGEDDAVDTTDDKDVVIRDASWYTDITVNRQIPVRGYISHRWCGTGKNKCIKEVWVRPHVKQGYHRAAGVKGVES